MLALQNIVVPERRIKFPQDAVDLVPDEIRKADREIFLALHMRLDFNARFLQVVSIGSPWMVPMDAREVFGEAVSKRTSRLILMHTHPHEETAPVPTDADNRASMEIMKASKVMKIPISDHIVLTAKEYLSLAEESTVVAFPDPTDGYPPTPFGVQYMNSTKRPRKEILLTLYPPPSERKRKGGK